MSMLGVDLNLSNPSDARAKIVNACVTVYFDRNKTGLHNYGDCSGFVKAVQQKLHLTPFRGRANDIYDELASRSDWFVLGSGSDAAARAGAAANAGSLTIAVWQNRGGGQVGWANTSAAGHVAIITAYMPAAGPKPEQRAIGAWGQLQSVGRLMGKMSESFGKGKHGQIRYARCLTPVF